MPDFDAFFEDLKKGVAAIAEKEAAGFVTEARADGERFLEDSKEDLKKWALQLDGGEMSKEDFEFLVNGKKEVMVMKACTQAGLAAASVERVRGAVVGLLIESVDKLI